MAGTPGWAAFFADGAYAGRLVERARRYWKMTVEIVSKPKEQPAVSPCCLGAGWSSAHWPGSCAWRRLVRDYERLTETHEAFVKWAMIGLNAQSTCPPPGSAPVGSAVTGYQTRS